MTATEPSGRQRALPGWARTLAGAAAVGAALLAMDTLRLFGGVQRAGAVIALETHYFYALMALLLPIAFLTFPATRRGGHLGVDTALALLAFAAPAWLFTQAGRIVDEGWEFGAPAHAVWVGAALWALVLEALRRAGGHVLLVLVAAFSLYPLVADHMPGALAGLPSTFAQTTAYHATSTESLLGLPFRAFADLVIGFLVFGVALQHTGGGRFFIDLAYALLGGVRGGPAKVAVVASGLMGSMSGSVITNVLTTGP